MERMRSFAPLIAITRDGGEGRVSLTKAGSVRVDYALDAERRGHPAPRPGPDGPPDPRGGRARDRGQRHAAAVARAAGVRAGRRGPGRSRQFEERLGSFDFRPNRGALFSAHQMGSVRMGADPRTHPCDPAGRVRAGVADQVVAGLYVADASLFPTAIGANPMLTVMALARRVARTVVSEG